jgi:uncharacterized protein (UPF0303 family)
MNELEKIIAEVEEQERTLVFDAFGSEAALELGMLLVERARAEKLAITVDVTKGGQVLFRHALAGTAPDNDQWVRRKNATVYRFHRSSYGFGLKLKSTGMTLQQFGASDADYSLFGGAFPVTVRGAGVVGTVTVSGLTQEEDHGLAVWALREYLEKRKNV